MSPTEISEQSEFARRIKDYFIANKPQKIIETGTYLGLGSTSIIASIIRDLPLDGAMFCSIECNPGNAKVAYSNLTAKGLHKYVAVLNGLSIPKNLLPSREALKKKIEDCRMLVGIKMDHEQDIRNAPFYYEKEIEGFTDENILGWILNNWNHSIDFALLDSGGHLGTIEFQYLISQLKYPCGIALDDTNHFKHYKSRQFILNDKRFKIINDSNEKFGFMIAQFTP